MSNPKYTCPCCGSSMIDPPEIKYLKHLKLSLMETTIVNFFVREYPRTVTINEIVSYVYSGVSGGSLWPEDVVRVTMSRTRKKLAKAGWTISNNAGGQGIVGKYQLEPMEKPQNEE